MRFDTNDSEIIVIDKDGERPLRRATAEPTVESCLAELREMFPGWHCEISTANYIGNKTDRLYTRIDVRCTDFERNDWTEYGATLAEAMQSVRRRKG